MRIKERAKQMFAGILALATTVTMSFPVGAFAEETSTNTISVTVSAYDYAAADAGLAGASDDGILMEEVTVETTADATVASILDEAAELAGIECELTADGYLDSINGLANDYAQGDGWYTSIDGDYSIWTVSDGAEIRADYSVENGVDINNGWDYSDYPNSKAIPPVFTSLAIAGVTVDFSTVTLAGEGTQENPYIIPMEFEKGTDLKGQQAVYETNLNSNYVKFKTGSGLTNIAKSTNFTKTIQCCLTGTVGSTETYYTICPVADFAMTVPAETELFVGIKPAVNNSVKHYVAFEEVTSGTTTDNGDGTKTYTNTLKIGQTYNYRISGEGLLTYGNKFTMGTDTEPITVTTEQLTGNPKQTDRNLTSNGEHNVADVYLNINDQHYLQMNAGETYQIVNLRNWEAVDSVASNYFIEPDYHYTVIDENGAASDVVTVNEAGVITANQAGTAMILVNYDAMTVYDDFYGAIWGENTGVIVVSVGAEESGIDMGMKLHENNNAASKLSGGKPDAELDVFYYLKGEEGAYYSFTPTPGSEVTLLQPTVTDNSLTYAGGFSQWGVTEKDGTYTVCLKHGRNIVKVTKDGKSEYQVLTAKEVSYVVENVTHPGEAVTAGDTVNVTFDTVYHPVNKLAGVYNMSAKMVYNAPENVTVEATGNQYAFATKAQTLTVTIPADYAGETIVLTDGHMNVNGWGDPYGNHRGITYTEGKAPNMNAQVKNADFAKLPDITIALATKSAQTNPDENKTPDKAENTDVKVTGLTIDSEKATLYVGQTKTLTVNAAPENATNKAVTWSSGNIDVAEVSSTGVVTAKAAGTAQITVTAADGSGKTATCEITVEEPTIQLNATSLKLQVKKSTKALKVSGLKDGDSIKSYTSLSPKVVAVNKNGKLTAKKVGKATIVVETAYGAKATCKVTVQKGIVKTKSISVNKKKLIVKKGNRVKLVVTRNPLTATDKMTFVSSNKKVASVNKKGIIRGKKKGNCKVRIKVAGKVKATVKVVVK